MMERKKTLTMNWDALGDHDLDDDRFFETYDRMSSVTPLDLDSSSDDEDDFDDPRASFASAISSVSTSEYRNYAAITSSAAAASTADYDIWMSAPGSITERRKRLLQGMGLSQDKDLLKIASTNNLLARVMSSQPNRNGKVAGEENGGASPASGDAAGVTEEGNSAPSESPFPLVLVRSRSEGDIESLSIDKKRKEQILGRVSKQRLTRTSSMIIVSHARVIFPYQESVRTASPNKDNRHRRKRTGTTPLREGGEGALTPMVSNSRFGAFVLIKNLDTGKEFIVNEYDQDGAWNRVSDLQTGKQLTLEEFEKCVGHSPVVKDIMRRQNIGRGKYGVDQDGNDRKINANNYFSKSLRMSKRTGAALIKNIMGVAHSMSTKGGGGAESAFNSSCSVREGGGGPSSCNGKEKEAAGPGTGGDQGGKQGWVKVRQTGKSYKELSALHLCQEIQAHDGSIWAIRFSLDGKYLASGGEDKVIHVWEVQECEVMSFHEGNLSSHPLGASPSGAMTPGIGEVTPLPSEKKKKKKGSASKRGSPIPEYVHVPETVFSLSEKPICTFTGHLDEVLDLSWSRSQLLLSSSMDKTVRLWDLETKSCLKLFAHNDYVTCIQFNPMDDNYFMSGSLDAKVRIWSIPDRQLVDWTDLHEMVTAVCFTPDGQGALIGSHKGSCRMYQIEDSKLTHMERVDLRLKKKSQGKKITGFQFSPGNPSELVVTTADSRIRVLDGSEVVHKFKGFRNVNSQISASYSLDGKYVISASEDSNVYIWKRDEPRTGAQKYKSVTLTRSYESFQCKDVSVAAPWPGTVKGDPPPSIPGNSKRNSKRVPASPASSAASSTCSSPTKEDAAARSRRHPSMQSPSASPSREETNPAVNSKRPPLPKKKDKDKEKDTSSDKPPEEDPSHIAYSEPGAGDESFASSSSSTRFNDPSSISASPTPSSSWSTSWSWFDGGNHNHSVQATAWGLVIVTATLNGEIRAYQNFGLPRRIGRL